MYTYAECASVSKAFKGRSRRWNFAPWDKGQCPHGALFHASPGCCKCFKQCRIARTARVETLELSDDTVGSTCNTMGQCGTCSMGTLSLVSMSKVASSAPIFRHDTICISNIVYIHMSHKCCCMQRANYSDGPAERSNCCITPAAARDGAWDLKWTFVFWSKDHS